MIHKIIDHMIVVKIQEKIHKKNQLNNHKNKRKEKEVEVVKGKIIS